MKPIFDFEQDPPPVLNETILRLYLERRRQRRQIFLAALAGLLLQAVLLLLGWMAAEVFPALTLASLCYTVISAAGGGVIAVAYVEKGGKPIA